MAYSEPHSTFEVPFWVGGRQKWISGISEETETGDIVKALIKADSKYNYHVDVLSKFVLVERWRQVEKPLRYDSKILKIWQAWGQEILDVKFVVKKHTSHSKENVRSRGAKRSDSKAWRQNQSGSTTDTLHPKCICDSDNESSITPKVEKLMKTIMEQGETIQAQILKLSLSSSKTLESFEAEDANEESSISLTQWTKSYEQVVHLNEKLMSTEEELFKLSSLLNSRSLISSSSNLIFEDYKSTSEELKELTELNTRLGHEIRRNECDLSELLTLYEDKKSHYNQLEIEFNRAESCGLKLKKIITGSSLNLKSDRHPLESKEGIGNRSATPSTSTLKTGEDSDTGLSSMHSSSSDDGSTPTLYALDTLV